MTDSDMVDRLARLDTTVVSDALDAFDLAGGVGGIRAQWGTPRLCGTVRTVALEPDPGDAPGPHITTEAVASASRGDVLVIANAGRTDVSCWGGLLSLGSTARGIAGAVVDGACRDVAEAEQLGFPVFARGTTPRTARGRLRQKVAGVTVVFAGVSVADRDLVIADDSGVAFIPRSQAEQVLRRAEEIAAQERAIAEEIRRGASLPQAMHDARLGGTTPDNDGTETRRRGGPVTTGTHDERHALDLLAAMPTAAISDALDRLALPGSLHGIGPLRAGQRACGPAFTVGYQPICGEGGTVGDYLDDVPAGAVVVIDNQGRTDCTVWGGIMTQVASASGVAATVINGVCRDVDTSVSTGYPIWSAGRFMRTGKDRVRLAAVQQPVRVGSTTVTAGDVVCCDDDGVVVVPAARAGEVARLAAQIEEVERRIGDAVRASSSLADARATHRYHRLQTAQDPAPSEVAR